MGNGNLVHTVSLSVCDCSGRLIKEFSPSVLDAQLPIPVFWDGRGNHGQLVNAGVYICQLKSSNNMVRTEMIVVR